MIGKQTKRKRQGVIAVLACFMLVALLGFVAFAVDVGYIVNARTELQRTADACSMAAAMQLPDEAAATAVAKQVARDNFAIIGPELDDSEVEFGEWDRDAATFITPPPGGRQASAVRVTLERSAAKSNPLTLFFAPLLNKRTADATATAIAMVDRDLCGPFIGIKWISVPGSPQTDSYNSLEGPYNLAAAHSRGSLCSDGPINIDGTAYVRGDARAGKEYDVTLTGNTTITGSIGSRLKPLNMPPVDASAAALYNDNQLVPKVPEGKGWKSPIDAQGNLVLDGNKTLDLPAGTYYFRDVIFSGQATLNISGKVKMYVVGNYNRAGGVTVNFNTKRAENFQIYMTGGTANVTSNNDMYGVIYAPNTNVTIDGDSDLFGAVVGKTLTVTGSGHGHYDESLGLEDVKLPMRSALVE